MAAVRSRPGEQPQRLAATLRTRHVSMIAFGGIIGAGIFVGSGQTIAGTGPGVVLSYLVAGLLAVVVMRMLTALNAQEPATGAFARYATKAFGSVGGFAVGWLYWWLMVVTVGVECSTATAIGHAWLPGVSQWIWAAAVMIVFLGANLMPVRVFAETQFWFVLIKVIALVLTLVAGGLAVFGALHGVLRPGTTNLLDHGGLFPKGASSVLTGLLVAVFSFVGTEMAAIAASESGQPRRTLSGAMRVVMPIMTILYVGSLLVVVTMVPWNSSAVATSPFSALFTALGVRSAGQVVDALVFLTVLSCLNSSMYAASRMAFSLAEQGQGARGLAKLSDRRVPARAVVLTAAIGFAMVAVQYVAPSGVFLVLVDSSGAVGLIVWLTIAASYLRLKPRGPKANLHETPSRAGFRYVAVAVVVIIIAMLVGMGVLPETQSQILATLSLAVLIVVVALWRDIM
ncbi:MAG TPA: amino acid permease [Pseudonocardiaceae bacterium]|jgi:L-asparagine transporter-like permease|nr:amino acid permease [Pseudonocardiaceae bacterium]